MSIVDTELWNLDFNERLAEWLFSWSTTRWAIYITGVDFWKSSSSLFTLNEEYCSAFLMDALYGACSVGGWCVIAVKCRSQRKYCFLLCSNNNSFFVSIFFFFFFWWSHFVSTCLMFTGHQGAWERLFVIKETTEWVSVFTWTWLSCSGLPWCTVLDRTAGVFVLRFDYSTCIRGWLVSSFVLIAFLKIRIYSSLSGSKALFIPLLIMRPAQLSHLV